MLRKILRKCQQVFNKPHFLGKDISIGKNVSFGKGVKFNCEKVSIGDGCIFEDNITIDATHFEIGDYGTISSNCFFPGPGKLTIGHNFWMGRGAILDSKGGTTVASNVCIAAGSQVWAHMFFGDVMMGCQFHSEKEVRIDQDVWIGPGCLISPVHMKEKSMALMGSLIVKDTEVNRIYAGVPANDVTSKMGNQFVITSLNERRAYLEKRILEFNKIHPNLDIRNLVKIIDDSESKDSTKINLNIESRSYNKSNKSIERKLIRFLLPEAKFTPE